MKSFNRKTIIWGIWFLVLVNISICFELQSDPTGRPLMDRLLQGILFCSIPYIFFTTFYVIAVITRQYCEMICLFIINMISSIAVIANIGYFYEGPLVARNSFVVIIGIMFIKTMVLLSKRPSIKKHKGGE